MKGIPALIVAGGLGIVGAILNFVYLLPASQERDLDYFIAVKRGVTVNRGTILKAKDWRRWGFQGAGGQSRGHRGALRGRERRSGAEHKMVCRTLTGGSLFYNAT